ncbi:uncharacterized protein GGS22DRAFT_152416 [Annulohypoxylon maeteangense]|uniref:uncharacterized protein n=1 Tax=Annulohypoxylon maeteangense TaxID=1927788 RepID=UPI002007CCF7|nr:uncharacterized protein GGS22DRAFT_152416 [Annulohypoxylon maeteangense]KAI0888815.1 hypothetical protein GGS22DRAFT_152416 [Annulohypoxylon maeteangense]
MPKDPAESIFEYLTTKNPKINRVDNYTKTLTNGRNWLVPKRILPWEDFNFTTLEKIFKGKLMEELRRGNRNLRYPFPKLDPFTECIETGEDTTTTIMTRWTRPMIQIALQAVDDVFSHVSWVASSRVKAAQSRPTTSEPEESPSRVPPSRKIKPIQGSSRRKITSRSIPDGGGATPGKQENRLPCEIKPGCYWTSSKLINGELADESGQWRRHPSGCRDAAPLLQIFNYCVKCEARYGFLITSKEVLAVRIRPKEVPLNPDSEDLIEQLHYQGLMEYKAISWDNHSTGDDYKELTISLAVWFLCILAGQDHRPQWNYCALADETLAGKAQSGDVQDTQSLTQASNVDSEDGDLATSSFTTQDTQSTGINHSFTSDGIGIPTPRRVRKRTRAREPPKEENIKKRRVTKV